MSFLLNVARRGAGLAPVAATASSALAHAEALAHSETVAHSRTLAHSAGTLALAQPLPPALQAGELGNGGFVELDEKMSSSARYGEGRDDGATRESADAHAAGPATQLAAPFGPPRAPAPGPRAEARTETPAESGAGDTQRAPRAELAPAAFDAASWHRHARANDDTAHRSNDLTEAEHRDAHDAALAALAALTAQQDTSSERTTRAVSREHDAATAAAQAHAAAHARAAHNVSGAQPAGATIQTLRERIVERRFEPAGQSRESVPVVPLAAPERAAIAAPVVAVPRAPEPARAQPANARAEQREVHVHIGAIEVRATPPPKPAEPPRAAAAHAVESAESGFDGFAHLRSYAGWGR